MERDDNILSFDPFAGDDCDVRDIANKMVVTRKPHECHNCSDEVPAGSRVRSLTQAFEGQIATWWWCVPCCEAMHSDAEWDEDADMPPFEARSTLRTRSAVVATTTEPAPDADR